MPDPIIPEPTVRITEYTISAARLPEDDLEASLFEINVQYRGAEKWAVQRGKRVLNAAGEWEWGSIPSELTAEELTETRFDLDTALRLACEALPKLRINGHTVADVLARAAW